MGLPAPGIGQGIIYRDPRHDRTTKADGLVVFHGLAPPIPVQAPLAPSIIQSILIEPHTPV
jgi:hypothetical protein